MQEMLLMLAGIMPKESLIEQLEEAITEYKSTKSDDAWHKITIYCTLITTKSAIPEGDPIGAITKMSAEMDQVKGFMDRVKPGN